MSQLRAPLRNVLVEPETDASYLDRTWRGIRLRRAQRAKKRLGTELLGSSLLGAGAATAFVLAISMAWPTPSGAPTQAFGPLQLATGELPSRIEAPSDRLAELSLRLSDGSALRLYPGAVIRTVDNNQDRFAVVLDAGQARFDVVPGGPRRWSVDAGLATVEVVGTSFLVRRNPDRLRVDVEHGVVVVRGPRVPGAQRELRDGEFVEVRSEPTPPPTPMLPTVLGGRPELGRSPVQQSADLSEPVSPSVPEWRELAAGRQFEDAYRALPVGGVAEVVSRASIDELFLVADVARLSGHPAEAVLPLTLIVSHYRSDPRAATASFTLGRLYMDALGRPAHAVAALREAIALGVRGGLEEDACARLVRACAQAGDWQGADAARQDYERRYPQGARLDEVRKWAGEGP